MAQRKIPTLPPTSNPGRNLPLKQNGSIPSVQQTQSPAKKRNSDNPVPGGKIPTLPMNPSVGKNGQVTMSEKQPISPSLYRHPLKKEKIDAMVKAAYNNKGNSDSVKVLRLSCICQILCICNFLQFQLIVNMLGKENVENVQPILSFTDLLRNKLKIDTAKKLKIRFWVCVYYKMK